MMKQAFRTYIASLHPRNIKKSRDATSIPFWLVYWFIFGPANMSNITDTNYPMALFFLFTKFAPLLLMWSSNIVTKISMPKAMFLVPMRMEDRKEYINAMLLIKICMPVIVSIILNLLFGMVYGMRWMEMFACAFAQLSFGIGMYVCSELRSKFDRYIRYAVRGKDGMGKDAWLNWMCMGISVFLILGFSAVDTGTAMTSFDWFVFLGGLMMLVIMDIVIIKTRYAATVEDICNYEVMFDVLGKVK